MPPRQQPKNRVAPGSMQPAANCLRQVVPLVQNDTARLPEPIHIGVRSE